MEQDEPDQEPPADLFDASSAARYTAALIMLEVYAERLGLVLADMPASPIYRPAAYMNGDDFDCPHCSRSQSRTELVVIESRFPVSGLGERRRAMRAERVTTTVAGHRCPACHGWIQVDQRS